MCSAAALAFVERRSRIDILIRAKRDCCLSFRDITVSRPPFSKATKHAIEIICVHMKNDEEDSAFIEYNSCIRNEIARFGCASIHVVDVERERENVIGERAREANIYSDQNAYV